jgi:hypothetical protein
VPESLLETVLGLPDEDMFTQAPVCGTCPEHGISQHAQKTLAGWELQLRHVEPCPRAGGLITTLHIPGCPTCHHWDDADLQGGDLFVPGTWTYFPKHAHDAITSSDGTIDGADLGEWCPVMKIDNERLNRVLAKYGNKPLDS